MVCYCWIDANLFLLPRLSARAAWENFTRNHDNMPPKEFRHFRHWSLIFGLLLGWLLAGAAAAQTPIVYAPVAGKAELVSGIVFVRNPKQAPRPLAVGDLVMEGDTIETGAASEAHVRLDDNGALAIRPNTRLMVVKFRAEGGDNDGMILSLVKGAVRGVSGWIGKFNRPSYRLKTPNSTIGVRGTDFEVIVVPKGTKGRKAGTYSKVFSGQIFLETARGVIDIVPGAAAFADALGKSVPNLLKEVPDLFRSYDSDHQFEKMINDLAGTFERARGERERVVRRLGADFNKWRTEQEKRRYDPVQDLKEFIDRKMAPEAPAKPPPEPK